MSKRRNSTQIKPFFLSTLQHHYFSRVKFSRFNGDNGAPAYRHCCIIFTMKIKIKHTHLYYINLNIRRGGYRSYVGIMVMPQGDILWPAYKLWPTMMMKLWISRLYIGMFAALCRLCLVWEMRGKHNTISELFDGPLMRVALWVRGVLFPRFDDLIFWYVRYCVVLMKDNVDFFCFNIFACSKFYRRFSHVMHWWLNSIFFKSFVKAWFQCLSL